jgi:hypothetical protein
VSRLRIIVRTAILRFVGRNRHWLPFRVYWFLLARLPFGFSFFDLSINDEDITYAQQLSKQQEATDGE